jgi:hypothetical protein
MRYQIETAMAGIAAGVLVSGVMVLGRRTGLLHKTLAEEAEDWLDRAVGLRRRIGATGTTAAEQINHLMVSAAFGAGYGTLRRSVPGVPPLALGLLYGGALYAIIIATIAPLIGLTRGEGQAPAPVILERLATHLLFGAAVAGFTSLGRERV